MPSTSAGPTDVRALTPEAFDAFDVVLASVVDAGPARLLELARRRIAMLLASERDAVAIAVPDEATVLDETTGTSLSSWPTSAAFDDRDRAVLELAEQFVIDVAGTGDDRRHRCLGTLGDAAFPLVQAIYVFDQGLRMRAALRQLFGTVDGAARPATDVMDLWTALEHWMRAVARLDALDPLTAELVRLRVARVHDCRLCRSRRHVQAVAAADDESVFDRIDDHERSDLAEDQKVALRLVDSMLWRPARLPDDVVTGSLELLGPAGTLEVVLDVGRNAANKIAVLFGADAPEVDHGVQLFDIDETGTVVTGPTVVGPSVTDRAEAVFRAGPPGETTTRAHPKG